MPHQRQQPATWRRTTPKPGEQHAEQRVFPPAKETSTHRLTTSSAKSKNDALDEGNDAPTNAQCKNDKPRKRKTANTDAKKNSELAERLAKSAARERSTKPEKQKLAPKREPQSAANGAGSANPKCTKGAAWIRAPSGACLGRRKTEDPTETSTPLNDLVAHTDLQMTARGQDAAGPRSQACFNSHRR